MAFVNAPNEIVYVKKHAKKTDYMIESLDDPLLGRVQTKGCIRTVIGNKLVILVVNEDMEFTLLKKKTMTYIRSFNFFRMIPISLAAKFCYEGGDGEEHIDSGFFQDCDLYLHCTNGLILKCMFDPNYTTKFEPSIIFHDKTSHFCINKDTAAAYVVTSALAYKKFYKPKKWNQKQAQSAHGGRQMIDKRDLGLTATKLTAPSSTNLRKTAVKFNITKPNPPALLLPSDLTPPKPTPPTKAPKPKTLISGSTQPSSTHPPKPSRFNFSDTSLPSPTLASNSSPRKSLDSQSPSPNPKTPYCPKLDMIKFATERTQTEGSQAPRVVDEYLMASEFTVKEGLRPGYRCTEVVHLLG